MADRFKGRVSHEIKALGTSIIVKGTVEIAIKIFRSISHFISCLRRYIFQIGF